ncbi:MAG TPA: hypothetical protein ENJ51_02505 [Leucothrix mucor]|uniref:Uncharacterized protein n=1 Tax=Leucothrix mucor TaxID=45248 RepID=A0A7V2SY97_LEUMU|nr:hypothetical protein [Leucothrix mucor]
MLKQIIGAVFIVTFITACGGSDKIRVAQGKFKDSGNTSGVSYESGQQSGVTGAEGSFSYEVGNTVRFSIGKVVLGETLGKTVIRPVDLVPNGNFDSIPVQNIVRFLMMLDDDTNPNTGINISNNVQVIAKTWPPIDFASQNFEDNLVAIIANVVSVEEKVHTLPTAMVAKNHLKSAFLCDYAGVYKGAFSGNDKGNFGAFVDAITGKVTGLAYSTDNQLSMTLKSESPIDHNNKMAFVVGSTSSDAVFKGSFISTNALEGTWTNDTLNGHFTGERVGGNADANYRFSAIYNGSDNGLFSFDIDKNNRITGVAYSIKQNKLLPLSGRLDKTKLNAQSSDNTALTATLDIATGKISGGWMNTEKGLFGTLEGTGCRLN